MDGEWLEVQERTAVLDASGVEIGSVLPGRSYRALEVGPSVVAIGGPDGSRGLIPRSVVRFDEVQPPSEVGDRTESDPSQTANADDDTPAQLPTWMTLIAAGLAVVAIAALAFVVVTRDDDEETSDTNAVAPSSQTADSDVRSVAAPETTIASDPSSATTGPTDAAGTTAAIPAAQPGPPIENRPAGPYVAPDIGTAISFGPPDFGPSITADICPSGSVSLLLYDVADRDGTLVRASGYGVVDQQGQGQVSVWYEDEGGHLVGFDEPGEPYAMTVTANTAKVSGARFDLDLVYFSTLTPTDAEPYCRLIDGLVDDLGV